MEIKRQIVESKFPPSNKEVWWFDVNSQEIKRYTEGKWTAVVTSSGGNTPDPGPEPDYSLKLSTGDPSALWIWVNVNIVEDEDFFLDFAEQLSYATDYQCEKLQNNGNYYGIEVRTDSDMTEDDVISVMEGIRNLFDSYAGESQLHEPWDITVVLPPSISTLNSDMFNMRIDWDYNLLTIVTDSVTTITSIIDEYSSADQIAITLICGMSTPPQVSLGAFGSEAPESHTVNVPKGTLSRYTEDTNWNVLNDSNMVSISELPEGTTLDDVLNRLKEV